MVTTSTDIKKILSKNKLPIIVLLVFLASAYLIIPQLGFFNTNWGALRTMHWLSLLLAVMVLLTSFGMAALVYQCLSTKRLKLSATYLVQVAGAFAGKVIPAGLGSISMSYLYLRKQRMPAANAATTVALNNILGFVGHGLWMLVLVTIWVHSGNTVQFGDVSQKLMWGGIGLAVAVFIAMVVLLQKRFRKSVRQVMRQLHLYNSQPWRIMLALGSSLLLTGCTIGMVYLSAQASDSSISFLAAAVALTAGLLAQTVTPTPGGVGGVEAGLTGGLVLTGLDSGHAVLVTITYRLISFWLPLLVGGMALVAVLRRKLI